MEEEALIFLNLRQIKEKGVAKNKLIAPWLVEKMKELGLVKEWKGYVYITKKGVEFYNERLLESLRRLYE